MTSSNLDLNSNTDTLKVALGAQLAAEDDTSSAHSADSSCSDDEFSDVVQTTPTPPTNLADRYRYARLFQRLDTRYIYEEIGGVDRLRDMFNRFYEYFFVDRDLSQFVTDNTEPHGDRFARWLAEKMTGEPIWSVDRDGMRGPSHYKSWYCPYRESARMGARFKVHDCRAWMRLNFLAAKEVGLADHEAFMSWYISFISQFISIYERGAPAWTHEALAWASDPESPAVIKYKQQRRFYDIPGLHNESEPAGA